jgi:hypothetical protein
VHSTTRYRENAVPKYQPFNQPLPDAVNDVSVIPDTALLPLEG